MENHLYPNFLRPFLENIDRRACHVGIWELISVFHYPKKTILSFGSDYLVRVSSMTASNEVEKKSYPYHDLDPYPEDPRIFLVSQSDQPDVVTKSMNEEPADSVSLRRGDEECQLPTL